jgi:hypothetical protein
MDLSNGGSISINVILSPPALLPYCFFSWSSFRNQLPSIMPFQAEMLLRCIFDPEPWFPAARSLSVLILVASELRKTSFVPPQSLLGQSSQPSTVSVFGNAYSTPKAVPVV